MTFHRTIKYMQAKSFDSRFRKCQLLTANTTEISVAFSNILCEKMYRYYIQSMRVQIDKNKALQYSCHSLSGHSQQRPPSQMWPDNFGPTTMNVFTAPSHQGPHL